MRKLGIVTSLFAAIALVIAASAPALAGGGQTAIGQWRVFSVMPSTSAFWGIDKAAADGSGGVQFPFSQFESTTTGSFAVYLTHNYNVALTGSTTITATANWTAGTYDTRSTVHPGAYARIEFQDVSSGGYTSNDYWWYSGDEFDLNNSSQAAGKTVTAALSDRAHWSNICGQAATDTTPHPGPNCVGGTDPAVSPYDGFTNAMTNVKEVNLAFGSSGSYASGVAAEGTSSATFDMTGFQVAAP